MLPQWIPHRYSIFLRKAWRRRNILIGLLSAVLILILCARILLSIRRRQVDLAEMSKPYYPKLSENDEPFPPYARYYSHRYRNGSDDSARMISTADSSRPRPHSETSPIGVRNLHERRRLSYKKPNAIRPCGEHLELNAHYMDRNYWRSLNRKELMQKRHDLLEYLNSAVTSIDYESFDYSGRGIVFTANDYTIQRALVSIRLLKHFRTTLPIEVWFMGEELNQEHLDLLAELSVVPRDILVEQKRYPSFADLAVKQVYGNARNYHIKTLVLLLTRFKEILYLDSDNMPLRDPEFLFGTAEFQETGALFWPDFWKFPIDNPLWRITGRQCEDEWEQESGQMVLDKHRSWRALLVSFFFQQDHAFYFRFLLGDKDTFRFAWKVTDTPYYMNEYPLAIAGRIRQGHFCGHTMVQHDTVGEILFMHTSALKTSHAINDGTTFETIQYFERSEPVALPPPSRNTLAFRVSYPMTYEYSGGITRRLEDGGVGEEIHNNPCIIHAIAKNVTIETTRAAVEAWGPNAIDSYRLITDDFMTYRGGKYSWFESLYYKLGGKPPQFKLSFNIQFFLLAPESPKLPENGQSSFFW